MSKPRSNIVYKLEYGDEVVSIGVALPVALGLDQGVLDLWEHPLVPLHDQLQLLVLLLLLISSPLLRRRTVSSTMTDYSFAVLKPSSMSRESPSAISWSRLSPDFCTATANFQNLQLDHFHCD